VVHRELVLNDVGRHALEALGDRHLVAVAEAVAVAADAGLVGQVGGDDDELVAFPASARIAEILPDRLADVRPTVGVDYPCVVDPLCAESDAARAAAGA